MTEPSSPYSKLEKKAGEELVHRLLRCDGLVDSRPYKVIKGEHDGYEAQSDLKPFHAFRSHRFEALGAEPQHGASSVDPKRNENKRYQIQAIALIVGLIIEELSVSNERSSADEITAARAIVDFCGGCGHVGILLAQLFPSWIVYVADINPSALNIVRQRAESNRLTNVKTWRGNIADFNQPFDIAVALHACGLASDVVLWKALAVRAPFVIIPCCTGATVPRSETYQRAQLYLKAATANPAGSENSGAFSNGEKGRTIDHPVYISTRSNHFAAHIDSDQYAMLARVADYGERQSIDGPCCFSWYQVAKTILEQDRLKQMEEQGFQTAMFKVYPLSSTPKNDILVGWPKEMMALLNHMAPDPFIQDLHSVKNTTVDANVDTKRFQEYVETLELFKMDGCRDTIILALGTNALTRKTAHAAAEHLKLYHESAHKQCKKCVVISKSKVDNPVAVMLRELNISSD